MALCVQGIVVLYSHFISCSCCLLISDKYLTIIHSDIFFYHLSLVYPLYPGLATVLNINLCQRAADAILGFSPEHANPTRRTSLCGSGLLQYV